MADHINIEADTRIDWVEPKIRLLAITETSLAPGRSGHDGETIWTDCTLS